MLILQNVNKLCNLSYTCQFEIERFLHPKPCQGLFACFLFCLNQPVPLLLATMLDVLTTCQTFVYLPYICQTLKNKGWHNIIRMDTKVAYFVYPATSNKIVLTTCQTFL